MKRNRKYGKSKSDPGSRVLGPESKCWWQQTSMGLRFEISGEVLWSSGDGKEVRT
jgi:hypothetical protein